MYINLQSCANSAENLSHLPAKQKSYKCNSQFFLHHTVHYSYYSTTCAN